VQRRLYDVRGVDQSMHVVQSMYATAHMRWRRGIDSQYQWISCDKTV
jgi:hypothetical protein